MASKVGMVVTYTPTEDEHPMLAGKPQAAVITSWDEDSEKANLTVFPDKANYVMTKEGAVEGTDAGTFQQPGSSTASASAAKAEKEKEDKDEKTVAAAHPLHSTHKGR